MKEMCRQARLENELVRLLPALRRFCRRFEQKPEDVEDLVQETVLKMLANLDKFTEGTSLKSWMFTIARHAFCTKHHIRRRFVPSEDEFIARAATIDAPQEWSLEVKEFDKAFSSLPANQQVAIEIVLLQGHSYEDAASGCRCAVGTIKSRVNRGRQTLMGRMSGSPAASLQA